MRGVYLGAKLTKVTPPKFAQLLDCMRTAACSIPDLQELTGLAQSTIREYFRALRSVSPPLINIEDWEEDVLGRQTTAKFRLNFDGTKKDKPKRTRRERMDRRAEAKRKRRATLALNNAFAGRVIDGRRLRHLQKETAEV